MLPQEIYQYNFCLLTSAKDQFFLYFDNILVVVQIQSYDECIAFCLIHKSSQIWFYDVHCCEDLVMYGSFDAGLDLEYCNLAIIINQPKTIDLSLTNTRCTTITR